MNYRSGREAYEAGCRLLVENSTTEAMEAFRYAEKHEPRQPAIPANIAHLYALMGHADEARSYYTKAISLVGKTDPVYEFRRALVTPVIFNSVQQIRDERARLGRELDKIGERKPRISDAYTEIGNPGFFLAYQNENDREFQRRIAALLLRACPNLEYAPGVSSSRGAKLKVGIFSTLFREHTIGRVNLGLIRELAKNNIEVFVIRPNVPGDQVTRQIDMAANQVVRVDPHPFKAREQIAGLGLDVLLYAEIGLDPVSYYLAFSRLAKVQGVLWGHPDTTGIRQVDYYFSSETFEPEGAQDHYTEKLVQLPRQYVCLEKPITPGVPNRRAFFGVQSEEHVYYCPQSPFKLHPDSDRLFQDILEADPRGVVCLASGTEPGQQALLTKRFAKLGELADRIKFVPRAGPNEFIDVMRSADALIDPIGFTGGYTTYLALSAGLPVLTIPGRFMRGRLTSGLYKQMEFEKFSFEDTASLAQEAVKLATDADYREGARREVSQRAEPLYEDRESIRFLAAKLEELYEAAH